MMRGKGEKGDELQYIKKKEKKESLPVYCERDEREEEAKEERKINKDKRR